MNNIELPKDNQSDNDLSILKMIADLNYAIKMINAEYQGIDFEDQQFLNITIFKIIRFLENREELYASR